MIKVNKTGGQLQLVPAGKEHVEDIARICFRAFRGVHDKHSFPRDIPSPELAVDIVGMMVERGDFYGVVALMDGKPVGSNFISLKDTVAGLGPITVDPSIHARGVGRALMQDAIDYAGKNNMEQIRLLQDSFNMASLSLYSSLGFVVRDPVAFMQAVPDDESPEGVRPAVESDVRAMDELCRMIYKVSRGNEIAAAVRFALSPFVIEREGRITGYLIPGIFGHGVAETDEDALALVGEAARRLPPENAKFFCPLREAGLYRKSLKKRHRAIKVMNLMSFGPYEPPDDVWMCSVLY
jgi:predicted N-acetyltransferase YhbS